MERLREAFSYAALTCAPRCAALLVTVVRNNQKVEEWRLYHNPTIGEVRSLREKGAIIMRKLSHRVGNQVDSVWISDNGREIVVRTDFLPKEVT